MSSIEEMMERERIAQALKRQHQVEQAQLGTTDFLGDPRLLKLPTGTLHKLLVKHMGEIYSAPPKLPKRAKR